MRRCPKPKLNHTCLLIFTPHTDYDLFTFKSIVCGAVTEIKKGRLALAGWFCCSLHSAQWRKDHRLVMDWLQRYTENVTISWSRNNFHWIEVISMNWWLELIFVTIVMILWSLIHEEMVKLTSVPTFTNHTSLWENFLLKSDKNHWKNLFFEWHCKTIKKNW